jgi:hypothetical protein
VSHDEDSSIRLNSDKEIGMKVCAVRIGLTGYAMCMHEHRRDVPNGQDKRPGPKGSF